MTFEHRVLSFCREQGLLERGSRVICAVSGGADSMALVWCLYLLREPLELTISAAHFNHGLRGGESDRDEEFVRRFCADYGIGLTVGRGQIRAQGRGLEDAARRARYAFLEGLEPGARIATAHTADDNAETVLLHLLRGAGLRGLGGIAPSRGRVIRPMLSVTRREVEEFLARWSVPHVEDSTNGRPDFLRNRIRSEVVPVLRRENPQFVQNCSRMALTLRQDQALLDGMTLDALASLRDEEGLDCPGLSALPPGLRSRVLAEFLQECGVPEPESVHLRRAEALARSRRPAAWASFPGGVCLGRRYEKLAPMKPEPALRETALAVPGVTRTADWEIRCRLLPEGEKIQNTPFTFAVACDTITKSTLVLRSRRAGDSLRRPAGHRSLRRLLMDRKGPAQLRDAVPVVADGAQVLAVGGIGVNLDFAAPAGGPAWEISLTNLKRKR